jgi:hypothetical protein
VDELESLLKRARPTSREAALLRGALAALGRVQRYSIPDEDRGPNSIS